MLLTHPERPERGVRLAYCLNLHAADDLEGTLEGIRSITVPLAERFDADALVDGFGVGVYLPAHVALALAVDADAGVDELARLLRAHRLDPFTYNAFPYGGFHREGLKEAVFRPTWWAPERSAFTLAVARLAARLLGDARPGRHVSVSTHTGAFAAWVEHQGRLDEIADAFALMGVHLAALERETGHRVVLSLEPEPRSLANDTRELPGLFERVRFRARTELGAGAGAEAAVQRHVGTCLDTCHAAVEFEPAAAAYRNATSGGAPLGKLQFSSALALSDPGARPAERARLLALAEPVYLHQVTGRAGSRLLRAGDLPALPAADADWLACDEWRCHFHVPVDLGSVGDDGGLALGTTRAQADELLAVALADPARWGTDELHVEIETYTWDVLPSAARGPGDLVDGLEREYRHVLARLAEAGWRPATRTREPS